MQYQGQVIDKQSGEPLASATITIDGTPVGVSDASGNFNIVTQVQGSEMTFSYVGYDNINVPLTQVNDLYQIGMQQNASAETLPEVVITPQTAAQANAPAIAQKDYTPYLIAGAAGLVLLGSTKRKGRAAGVGKMSTGMMLAIAAGGGLLLYLLLRPRAVTPVVPMQTAYSPAYLQAVATQGNPVAQDITAGAGGVSAVSNLVSAISNL